MKRFGVILLAAVIATAGLSTQVALAQKKAKAASMKEERWSGIIQRSNKDNSTLVVRKGTIEKTIVYDSSTKWTKLNKDGAAMGDFKDGSRVIVLGKYDDKGRLVATRIDLRAP